MSLRVKRFALGASASMTLTACYGAAPPPPNWNPSGGGTGGTNGRVEFPKCDELSEALKTEDRDHDEYCGMFDCNEDDPAVNVAAPEVAGDGIDQNCNGEDLSPPLDGGR